MPGRDQSVAPGPTGLRASHAVSAFRLARGLTKVELSAMLGRLGRPMTVDVLTKLEDGRRRIDVDDLIALAAALDVSPTRLLLCASTKQSVELLPEKTVSGREAWQWLRAEWPLDERLPGRRSVRLWRLRRFWQENATPSLVV